MEEVKKYWPIILILFMVACLTILAVYVSKENEWLMKKESTGFPLWLTPIGYTLLVFVFKGGLKRLNRPIFALGCAFVYLISASILLIGGPVQQQWHLPMGIAAFIYVVFL